MNSKTFTVSITNKSDTKLVYVEVENSASINTKLPGIDKLVGLQLRPEERIEHQIVIPKNSNRIDFRAKLWFIDGKDTIHASIQLGNTNSSTFVYNNQKQRYVTIGFDMFNKEVSVEILEEEGKKYKVPSPNLLEETKALTKLLREHHLYNEASDAILNQLGTQLDPQTRQKIKELQRSIYIDHTRHLLKLSWEASELSLAYGYMQDADFIIGQAGHIKDDAESNDLSNIVSIKIEGDRLASEAEYILDGINNKRFPMTENEKIYKYRLARTNLRDAENKYKEGEKFDAKFSNSVKDVKKRIQEVNEKLEGYEIEAS